MAKYEMSGENDSGSRINPGNVATSSTVKAVSKPGVKSWWSINVANCYENSYNYDRNKESHLMKNSEWGACAYLTQSTYGRNGHEIDINNSYSGITGNGGGAVGGKVDYKSGITNAYNTQLGARASTTGNIYGIYDMSGSCYEFTATFNKECSEDYFGEADASYKSAVGTHFASNKGASTKYATAYSNRTNTMNGSPTVYSVSKTGDGIKEVFNKTVGYSWTGDFACYVSVDYPFMFRGGTYEDGENAGVFYSYRFC